MLFALYADPSQVKFTEWIPHFLVRASSAAKARQLARLANPAHPISLDAPTSGAAPLGFLRVLKPTQEKFLPFFFCDAGHTDAQIRALAADFAAPDERATWLCETASVFEVLPQGGRAEVFGRVENLTPRMSQKSEDALIFCWRVVKARWPNPDA